METALMAAQPQYFFYEPDHNRNHLAHHPMMLGMHQLPAYPPVHSIPPVHVVPMHPVPSTPMYNCSSPACSPSAVAQPLYSNRPLVLTPQPSPSPTAMQSVNKPPRRLAAAPPRIVVLDPASSTSCDSPFLPTTPPLSCSGAALQTPMNPMFSGLDGPRNSFEMADDLTIDWSTLYLPTQIDVSPLDICSRESSVTSCASLSPIPIPLDQPLCSAKLDVSFCDPRDLTVTSTHSSNLYSVPSKLALATDLPESGIATYPVVSALHKSAGGLPPFEDLSEVDSDDDSANELVGDSSSTPANLRRPRACTGSSVVSLGHASFFCDDELTFDENDDLSYSHLPSPPSSFSSFDDDCHHDKRVRTFKNSDLALPIKNYAVVVCSEGSTPVGNQTMSQSQDSSSSISNSRSGSPFSSTFESKSPNQPLPTPVNRRGRKQSLTEDPSKTFVCDLCHRRFRRQEHLKRHYRSLHTHDKPFECHECGKTFSRSDNLAQHARTHGSGAIIMDLINDCTTHSFDSTTKGPANDYHMGKVLFHLPADLPINSCAPSPEDSSSDRGQKKRRRAD